MSCANLARNSEHTVWPGMNRNGAKLLQVVHSHRASYRNTKHKFDSVKAYYKGKRRHFRLTACIAQRRLCISPLLWNWTHVKSSVNTRNMKQVWTRHLEQYSPFPFQRQNFYQNISVVQISEFLYNLQRQKYKIIKTSCFLSAPLRINSLNLRQKRRQMKLLQQYFHMVLFI